MSNENQDSQPTGAAGSTGSHGRVVVAMSGGVDSSTTAALLVEQGYEVVGLTMQLYDYRQTAAGAERSGSCCSIDDVSDARSVAEHLGIPFYVVNFQEAFRKLIVDNLVEEYLGGRTPNPCVRCNEFMKFRLLLDRALALGAEFLATGHYAQIVQTEETGEWKLLRGVDDSKDQSYFLYPVGQKQLSRMRFPLGGMTKAEVREHSRRLAVPTAEKRESQDVCFIAGESYRKFMERTNQEKLPGRGEVVTVDGQVIGQHDGHHRYTVGQRRGLGLPGPEKKFVVSVSPEKNRVVVGGPSDLDAIGVQVGRFRWISGQSPEVGSTVEVKIRYRSEASMARITHVEGRTATFEFSDPVRAVTPGQAAVAYRGNEVLGGGVIETAIYPQISEVLSEPREMGAAV